MSRNVLVLGSTGTTGREVVRALLARDANVRAATRNPGRASFEGAEVVAFDPDDVTTWAAAFAGIDALYFVLPSFRPDEAELGGRIIDAAREAGVSRFVKLSAMGMEHFPESGHRRVELAIEQSGADWIHLRPTFFTDNLVNFHGPSIANDGVIALPAGEGRTGFVAASDIGALAAEALLSERTAEVWEITGPESLTHGEVAAILTDVLGRTVQFVNLTPEQYTAGMAQFGMGPVAQQTMGALYAGVRAGQSDAVRTTVNDVLGREPQSVREWVEEHAGVWRAIAAA